MRWAASSMKFEWGEDEGRPIPIPWPKLESVLTPKVGNTCIVIAAPGVGKTTMLLNWATSLDEPVLFISSDTAPKDITVQLAALATGHELNTIVSRLTTSSEWREQYAQAIFQRFPHLLTDFDPSPSTAAIRLKVEACREVFGVPPRMLVMDTASNVAMSDMGSNAEWQRVWLEMIGIARDAPCFVVMSHHVKQGAARSGRLAPTMSDGLWGSDQFPEFVLGLHNPELGKIQVTVLKNRTGPKDVPVKLDAEFRRASIGT